MTSRDFCYWLQGYFELAGTNNQLTPDQIATINRHLKMVFVHEIDPSFPPEQQETLNQTHKPDDNQPVYRC